MIDRRTIRRACRSSADLDGDGDLYDDSFLSDTRLRPLPQPRRHAGAGPLLGRDPAGTRRARWRSPAAVYYQSIEAMVAKKFLGNLADTDTDFVLEPCVLGGPATAACPPAEPAVVEGAPPVPMEVRNWLIQVARPRPRAAPTRLRPIPRHEAQPTCYRDVVVKVTFSEPVTGVDARDVHA